MKRGGFPCVGSPDEQDSVASLNIRLDLFQVLLNQILPLLFETVLFFH